MKWTDKLKFMLWLPRIPYHSGGKQSNQNEEERPLHSKGKITYCNG